MADWLVALPDQAPRRPGEAQPLLRHRSRGDLRRHRPAAHVDRGAAGVDAAIAGAFLRARRAGRAARSRRPRLPQCRRDRGAGAWRDAGFGAVSHLGCSRRRGRRWSMPRRISASRSASTRTSSCRWPRSGRCGKLWARVQEVCSIPPSRATIHAETSYRMMTAQDPETNILRTTIAGFRGRRRRRRFDLGPAAHDRARPARRLRAPHRAQHAAHHGRRKPSRFRRRPGIGLRRHRGADRRAMRSSLGGIPDDRKGRRHPAAASPAGTSRRRIAAARDDRAAAISRRQARDRRHDRSIRGRRAKPVETLAAQQRPLPTDGAVFCERLTAARIDESDRRPCNDPRFHRHRLDEAKSRAARRCDGGALGTRRKASRSSASTASAILPACRSSTPGRALAPYHARPLPDHVCPAALDDPPICRLLDGGGIQRLLPPQPRRRPERPLGRLRSRHPSRLRQRPSARRRRCRHGRRGDQFHPRHAPALRRHSARRDDRVDDHERRGAADPGALHRRRRRNRASRRRTSPGPSRTTF